MFYIHSVETGEAGTIQSYLRKSYDFFVPDFGFSDIFRNSWNCPSSPILKLVVKVLPLRVVT